MIGLEKGIDKDPVHRLINYIDTKANCRHLKKFTWKGTLRQVIICHTPPSPRYTLYTYMYLFTHFFTINNSCALYMHIISQWVKCSNIFQLCVLECVEYRRRELTDIIAHFNKVNKSFLTAFKYGDFLKGQRRRGAEGLEITDE